MQDNPEKAVKESKSAHDPTVALDGSCQERTHIPLTLSSGDTGTYTRALCQKNEGSVTTKQRPVKMGGRPTYRTLSPKRAPFQIGVD
jgi:hypothetical protein